MRLLCRANASLGVVCLLFVLVLPALSFAQQWQSTGGPFSGEVTSVAVIGDVDYAGTAGKGLFYRGSGDPTWTNSPTDAFDGITIHSIAAFNGRIIAATHGKGIWQSLDGGENWSGLNAGLNATIVRDLMPSSDGRLYAGTSSGLYRLTSNDDWIELQGGVQNHDIRTIVEDTAGVLYVGSHRVGVIRSSDLGLSWDLHGEGLESSVVRTLAITADNELFVGTFGGAVIQRYDADSDTWLPSGEGLGLQGVWAIAVSPDGKLYTGTPQEGIFTSDDGATWERQQGPQTVISEFTFSNGRVLAASKVGFLSSTDGGIHWTLEGIPFSRVNTLHRIGDRVLAGLSLGGIHYSDDGGLSWHPSNLNNTGVLSIAENEGGTLLAGTLLSGLYQSIDQGETWERIWKTFRSINSVDLGSPDTILTATEGGVYRLGAPDSTWQLISPTGIAMRCVLTTSNGTLLAGSERESIWRSEDSGQTWMQVANQLINNELWTVDLVQMTDGRLAAATTGLGIWVSGDDGLTWQSLPGTVDVNIADLAFSPNGTLVAAGLFGQVFVVPTDAYRADATGPPFQGTRVRSVTVLADGTVTIGTDPLGVYYLDHPKVNATEREAVPSSVRSVALFPNPTNETFNLQISLDRPNQLRWEIVDVLGRARGVGVSGKTGTTDWNTEIDVSSLAPGLYWIRLHLGDQHLTRSVVVWR